jgi:1,4-dihydroxy-2-naphthoate octaprenyltransferase
MTKNQAWIKALRLRTLPLSLSGIILGSAIAFADGFADAWIFVLALLTTILFQILSNLANDLGDTLKGADNADRIGPLRSVQSGLISIQEMKRAVILVAILSFCTALPLIVLGTRDLPLNVALFYSGLALVAIFAAIAYTMGKKAYGYLGLGDLFVFLFFGLVSVLGVYPLYAKELHMILILPATAIGLLSVAVLNLNNMRDRVNDEKVGKNTLVVKLGANLAKIYHTILVLGALVFLTLFLFTQDHKMAFLGLIPGLYLLIHLKKVLKTTDPIEFDPELKKVALTTFAIAVLTSLGLVL